MGIRPCLLGATMTTASEKISVIFIKFQIFREFPSSPFPYIRLNDMGMGRWRLICGFTWFVTVMIRKEFDRNLGV